MNAGNLARFCSAALAAALTPLAAAYGKDCPVPSSLKFVVEKKIERSERGLTQGLEFHDGKLYESTGRLLGETRLNAIGLDGTVRALSNHGASVFGEGLTILEGEVFQLTWQDNLVFVYDLAGNLTRRMANPHLGWGLASDGQNLLFTDGEGVLRYADPATFAITREVELHTAGKVSPQWMNELEYVDGRLYGNVFTTDWIIRVDPENGCVEASADMTPLRASMTPQEKEAIADSRENVLNGIARDPQTGTFYITGKRWPVIFAGRFVEAGAADGK